jgi:hypothetical protein
MSYFGWVAGAVSDNVVPEPAADGAVHAVSRHLLLYHHLPGNPHPRSQQIQLKSAQGRTGPTGRGRRESVGASTGRNQEDLKRGLPGIRQEEDALQHPAALRRSTQRSGGRRALVATNKSGEGITKSRLFPEPEVAECMYKASLSDRSRPLLRLA